jgi:Trk-type K+ transport system membrane component
VLPPTPKRKKDFLHDALVRLVYGSNMIGSAGSSLAITQRLCTAVFTGAVAQDTQTATEISSAGDEYQEHVDHLRSNRRSTSHEEVSSVFSFFLFFSFYFFAGHLIVTVR